MWLFRRSAIIALLVASINQLLDFSAASATTNGSRLYFANGTCIWSLMLSTGGGSVPRASSLTCTTQRAVGLAVDAGIVFWSDVDESTAGVYRVSAANPGDARKIVSGVRIVNCLTVDRVARRLYWTDEGSRLIEAADYDGGARIVVVSYDLSAPRGLLVDESAGFLYWNDQDKGTLESSRLDGSERRVLVDRFTLLWPNQMTFADSSTPTFPRDLFFADGFTGHIHRYDALSGRVAPATLSRLSPENVTLFGIVADHDERILYASDWAGNVYELNATLANASRGGLMRVDSAVRRTLVTGYNVVFSLALLRSDIGSKPQTVAAACQVNNGGCSHVCLRRGNVTSTARRCACPSHSGLALAADGRSCREPQQLLVYSSAGSGLVAFRDLSGWAEGGEVYAVAQSTRPVAVAYDSLQKMVYWSDVDERFIASIRLNGSDRRYLLPPGSIGIVDGMSFDDETGNLYFTNLGEIDSTFTNDTYSWHTVEVISTTTLARRILLSSELSRPRALAIDYDARHLYVSDWGSKPKVIQCRMDGSGLMEVVLSANWSNPNALLVHDSYLYVLDARLVNGTPTTLDAPTLTRINVHSKDWIYEAHTLRSGMVPYGLAISGDQIYISDWNSSSILAYGLNGFGSANATALIENVTEPMALAHVTYSAAAARQQEAEDNQGCSGYAVCIKNENHKFVGYCPNVGTAAISKSPEGCQVPDSFLIVADLTSLRIRDLDSEEEGLLVSRDPFASNLVGVAYDRKTRTVYYSDADEGSIYAVDINKAASPRRIFSANGTVAVDGLALDDATSTLYWTASAFGDSSPSQSYIAVAKVGRGSREAPADFRPSIALRGLLEPRGILPLDGVLYWTERGQRPRVQYADVATIAASSGGGFMGGIASPKMLSMRRQGGGRPGLRSPNSIAASVNQTYVGDTNEILVCSRQGTSGAKPRGSSDAKGQGALADQDCSSLPVEHVFGLAASRDGSRLFYTDWRNRAVLVIEGNNSARPLLSACVRPSMLVVVESSAANQPPTAKQATEQSLPPWAFGAIAAALLIVIVVAAVYCLRRRRQRAGGFNDSDLLRGGGGSRGGEDNNAYVLSEKMNTKDVGYAESIPIYEPVECTKS